MEIGSFDVCVIFAVWVVSFGLAAKTQGFG